MITICPFKINNSPFKSKICPFECQKYVLLRLKNMSFKIKQYVL